MNIKKIKNKIKNKISSNEITYVLDEVFEDYDEVDIRGWAYVYLGDNVYDIPRYELMNIDGDPVKCTYETSSRKDVNLMICGGTQPDNKFGFMIRVKNSDIESRYSNMTLKLIYGNNIQEIEIDIVAAAESYRRYKSIEDMERMADKRQAQDDEFYKAVRGRKYYNKVLANRLNGTDVPYMAWRRYQEISDEERIRQSQQKFDYMPCISILVPAYRTPRDFLVQMIESVVNQTYANWQLCIADASLDDSIVDILEDYHKRDSRVVYKLLEENLGISDNTNAALDLATGDFIALLDHDDLLDEDALYEVVKCINEEQVDVVYTDEDKVNMTLDYYFEPHYKPDYNRELLMSCNYITHFFVVKRDIVDRVGLLDNRFDGSQDFEFILRCTNQVEKVGHVRKVVYHWRCHPDSTAMNPETKMYCYTAGVDGIQNTLDAAGIKGEAYRQDSFGCYGVRYPLNGKPKILTIVVNGDKYLTDYENETVEYLSNINDETIWSEIMKAEKIHDADYVFIVQGNGEMTGMEDLIANIARDDIGMVGAKVTSSDGLIVEAGRVVSRNAGCQNVCLGMKTDDLRYDMRTILQQEVMAYGLNGIMIPIEALRDYVENKSREETLNQYIENTGEKIVYVPIAEYRMNDDLNQVMKNYIDIAEPVGEDRYYSSEYSLSGDPYTFSW
ncbi:MAG: glycosyltransferase [Lachnospiraceae bacterium]|nr:glycosyltransferase [Lachnospiraceae bacterium]